MGTLWPLDPHQASPCTQRSGPLPQTHHWPEGDKKQCGPSGPHRASSWRGEHGRWRPPAGGVVKGGERWSQSRDAQDMDTAQGTGTFPKGPPNSHQTPMPSQLPAPGGRPHGGHVHACPGDAPKPESKHEEAAGQLRQGVSQDSGQTVQKHLHQESEVGGSVQGERLKSHSHHGPHDALMRPGHQAETRASFIKDVTGTWRAL